MEIFPRGRRDFEEASARNWTANAWWGAQYIIKPGTVPSVEIGETDFYRICALAVR